MFHSVLFILLKKFFMETFTFCAVNTGEFTKRNMLMETVFPTHYLKEIADFRDKLLFLSISNMIQ